MQKDAPTQFPTDAKKVFDGVIYDVYQWPQELYDGTTVIYERINRQDTISVLVVTEDNQIMLIEEEQPHREKHISLVAGKIDFGETPLEAANRELLEETGFQAASLEPWFEYQPDSNIDWTVFTYIAKGAEKVADQALEGGERITPKFFTFEEFVEFALSEEFHALSVKIKILEAKLDPEKMEKLRILFFS